MNELVNKDDINIFDTIDYYLSEYCETRNIQDEYSIPDQQYSAALMYIYMHTFAMDKSILRVAPRYTDYNLYRVSLLCDKYIYMSFDHNQKISIQGFCMLSGIDMQTIYNWKNNNSRTYIYLDSNNNIINVCRSSNVNDVNMDYCKKLTYYGVDIYNKLLQNEEKALHDRLTEKKRNPMTTLPAWNLFQTKKQQRKQSAITYNQDDIASQLGIFDQIALISDNSNTKD